MPFESITVDELVFKLRAGTYDRQQLTGEWRLTSRYLRVDRSDRWLDCGAHIGMFTCRVARRVSSVLAVEADDENFNLLLENIAGNELKNATAWRAAVTGRARTDEQVILYRSTGANPGTHSLVTKRGRVPVKVSALNINDAVKEARANKVKLDVEGAEVDILFNISEPTWSRLKGLQIEFHHNALRDKSHKLYHEVLELLRRRGFIYYGTPDPKGAWATNFYVEKP